MNRSSPSESGVVPQELIEKYSVSGPRYTSYPTAASFSGSFSETDWWQLLDKELREETAPRVALYTHIPFCRTLCFFCACTKIVTKDRSQVPPYLELIRREIDLYRPHLTGYEVVEQLHWGGGSPNYLNSEQMQQLFQQLRDTFPRLAEDADISVELDPRTTDAEQLECLRSLGFNRVSFGIQDFDPQVQRAVNRYQTVEQAQELIERCRELGIASVSIDLIYGLPKQTAESFAKTLELAVKLRPDRIAMYGYAHVQWIAKAQQSFNVEDLPTPAQRIELLALGIRTFTDAGYRHIGMDHFALPGDQLARALDDGSLNRNFMGYSTHQGARVLGFGLSAISGLHSGFAQNEKAMEKYSQKLQRNELPVERGIVCSMDDQLRSDVIASILCAGRVDKGLIERKFRIDFDAAFAEAEAKLEALADDGLVTLSEAGIFVTELGRYFLRNIAMAFDARLPNSAVEAPRYSATV